MKRSLPHKLKTRFAIATATGLLALAVGHIGQDATAQQTPLLMRSIGQSANDFPGGQACASGIAINITFGHVCTHRCAAHSHCPPGWGCKAILQGNSDEIGLCFPRRHQVSASNR